MIRMQHERNFFSVSGDNLENVLMIAAMKHKSLSPDKILGMWILDTYDIDFREIVKHH